MTTKLLAVDDSNTLRKVLQITFAGEEFETELAASAGEALQKLQSHRPAIVVVDAHLGASNGYDLCAEIKKSAPGTRVLLLSSKHRPYDASRGEQVGADDHMDKPFDTQKLIDKVSAVMAQGPRAGAPAAAAIPRPAAPSLSASPAGAGFGSSSLSPGLGSPTRTGPTATTTPARPAVSPGLRPALGGSPSPGLSPATTPLGRPAAPAVAAPAARPVPAQSAAPAQPAVRAQAAPPAAPAQPATPAAGQAPAGPGALPAEFATQLQSLGLSAAQMEGVLALSRDVVERVVWEVVPVLAETLIKEEIARLTAD